MATGGTITTDGPWDIHTFTANGTFVCDDITGARILLVGGGAGAAGGGGGAGGVTEYTDVTIPGSSYSVVRGSYGAGSTSTSGRGSSGSASTITALGYSLAGGGGGGKNHSGNGGYEQDGAAGGCGGGGGAAYSTAHRSYGGVGSVGGNGGDNQNLVCPAGGGGGQGRNGYSATSASASGPGGYGVSKTTSNPDTGSGVYYGGGGGGGNYYYYGTFAGGTGGGGNGKGYYDGAGGVGTHYLGGGGGGCGLGYLGGRGGYGVVIIAFERANEGAASNLWMAMNFAILVGLGFFNTIGLRIMGFAEHIHRNGIKNATRCWLEDIDRYGLFWRQRLIREWKKMRTVEEIFSEMETKRIRAKAKQRSMFEKIQHVWYNFFYDNQTVQTEGCPDGQPFAFIGGL